MSSLASANPVSHDAKPVRFCSRCGQPGAKPTGETGFVEVGPWDGKAYESEFETLEFSCGACLHTWHDTDVEAVHTPLPLPNRLPVEHDLKTWPALYEAVEAGLKPFEIRQNDRPGGFAVGDTLILREWDPTSGTFSGRFVRRRVSYVLSNWPGLTPGYVCIGLA